MFWEKPWLDLFIILFVCIASDSLFDQIVWFRCKPKEKDRMYQLYLSLQSLRQHCGMYCLRTADAQELQYWVCILPSQNSTSFLGEVPARTSILPLLDGF